MKFKPVSPQGIKTYSLKSRSSKVNIEHFSKPYRPGSSVKDFINSLPHVLAAKDLKELARIIAEAWMNGHVIMAGIGAHVIKVGLAPVLIDLVKRGIIQAIAMNGAGIVHDFEIAFGGATSEDVDAELGTGSFGMAEETGKLINEAINGGIQKGWGIGKSVGEMINRLKCPYRDKSILAMCEEMDVPVTVHVAVGTDILHVHPFMRGDTTGEGTYRDFLLFAGVVANLENGVYLNIGSAVILPEVFLKALTLVRNLGYKVQNLTTINMDFISHYRPLTNVVRRPTKDGMGKGYNIVGHHEIMLPLLAAAIIENISNS